MSIIERVAELLGPIEPPDARFSTPGKGVGIGEQNLIERAIDNSNERSRSPEAWRFPGQPVVKDLAAETKAGARPGRSASRTTRTLKVDLDRLRKQSIITPNSVRTPVAEGFRRIKRQILANVDHASAGAPPNLVMVTSALPGEGKTFCAINLAISVALEMDRTVLLVDADVAKPSVPKVLGLKAEKGLLDLLLDPRMELSEVLCKTDIGKLTLLPAGTAHQHATELLASDAMRVLLKEMAERYHDRIIIFDSPPLLAASEAGALARQMGQIVMVVESGKTAEAAVKAALGRIESSNFIGLLLNKGYGPGLGYDYGGYG